MTVQRLEVLLQDFANLPRPTLRGSNLLSSGHCNRPSSKGIHMSTPRLVKGGKGCRPSDLRVVITVRTSRGQAHFAGTSEML